MRATSKHQRIKLSAATVGIIYNYSPFWTVNSQCRQGFEGAVILHFDINFSLLHINYAKPAMGVAFWQHSIWVVVFDNEPHNVQERKFGIFRYLSKQNFKTVFASCIPVATPFSRHILSALRIF